MNDQLPQSSAPAPLPSPEGGHLSGLSHKTIIIAGISGIVLGLGVLWYLGVISLDVFRAPAAELPSILPAPRSTLTAQCSGGESPQVELSWTKASEMQTNGLLRTLEGGQPVSLLGEDGPEFSTFTFTDTTVQFGLTYSYEVVTGIGKRSNLVRVEVTKETCK